MAMRFVIIDLETTGNGPKKGDRIIQLGMAVVEGRSIVERFASFFNPEQPIPPFIQQLTNIDEQTVEEAPLFADKAGEIAAMMKGAYFVAHNVDFDLPFLQAELERAGRPPFAGPTIDTVELARIVLPSAESYKLGDLAKQLGLRHDRPHQADSDAEVTAKLFIALLGRLHRLPLLTLEQLRRLARHLKSDIYSLLDAVIAEKRKEAPVDDTVAVYRGIALKKPAPKPDDGRRHSPSASFAAFYEQAPPLPLPGYKRREGQWEMMRLVYEALSTSQHALIEAGTGLGKSLAYLIPAAFFAGERQERVVVSTHTLQLQEQLIRRDLPVLRQVVPFPLRVAVLKGKQNYLSLDKFVSFLSEPCDTYDAALLKCQLLVWLLETDSGDLDELNVSSGARLLLSELAIGEGEDGGRHHFFAQAKQRAERANIVITNHAFLLHDLTASSPLLPPFRHLVIDEAHRLEDAAAHSFGERIDYVSFRLLTAKIAQTLGKWPEAEHGEAEDAIARCQRRLEELQFEGDELFRLLRRYALAKKPARAGRCRCRFSPADEGGRTWQAATELCWRLRDSAAALCGAAMPLVSAPAADGSPLPASLAADLAALERQLATLVRLLTETDPSAVRWIEADEKGAANAVRLYSQPVDLADFFADRLFMKKRSVILTSATLTVRGRFAYMTRRLGLDEFYPLCRSFPAPFRYEEQAALFVPADMPLASAVSVETYAEAAAAAITAVARRVGRRLLVLFPSYELLKMTVEALKNDEADEPFVLIAQGVQSGSPAKLIRTFLQFERAVLFGTSGFWEGVDLPGDALDALIIARLPFAPPDDPVMEAKSERIRARGGDPFYELSLPEAVLRLKQGVGRLIRTERDKGVVFVLDRRLTNAPYRADFLASLPPLPVHEGGLLELLDAADAWLWQGRRPNGV
ncbi:DinG family ATP-dependent helicase YoaA [Geobacillus stearothermophilus]|uniref:3'-5' exonuclease DinG n=2 Tax=Geobacillus stearothermophilus TaxID=1422 RepID=A0ABQ7HC04_GEOSE|nr:MULTISPECIES: ATP-dependent DNA helicase DinG [Geobacillus]KAF6509726.1 DinG family ATP-dependent helicase YoaA [Geobacillus stearothermophilus]KMY58728.1 DNA polymerase III subunit epsilon [Geobacillus stearothermophilus]KMY60982.1 DNA polymerase III subunit epsilon [Geobacillus stearothermophilus]KMY64480.1 DNA polymerase III subunit epsilon [Geobacillus stearothermophilus]MBR2517248.1 ATP-dependent DNA helicase DinG [Geobacillus sp.]